MRENKRCILCGLFILIAMCLFQFSTGKAIAMNISPTNVQAIAVYGESSNFGIGLTPAQLQYNITTPADISTLLSPIEFSTVRDCSAMGSRTNAYVYIKYKDGATETYDLFGTWSHISKAGLRGICLFVSQAGQVLFENYAQ
jgi:hypothetical protein